MSDQIEALGQAVYESTRRTVDGFRRLSGERAEYFGSVAACESLPEGDHRDRKNEHAPVESGPHAPIAVHHGFAELGCAGNFYNPPPASALTVEQPDRRKRWQAALDTSSFEGMTRTPPGFYRVTALAGLQSSPAVAAAKLTLVMGLFLLSGRMEALRAQPPAAALPAGGAVPATSLTATPGNHVRKITVDGLERSYVIHFPRGLDPEKPAPLVLMLHGAAMNGPMMARFTGMNAQADAAGFIAVYPNGTGLSNNFLAWNAGGIGPARTEPDDVAFIGHLLDQLNASFRVDSRRIYAAGMSNGAMMCYRLALEMPQRFAAIAAVGGTLGVDATRLPRAVSVIHFHGTDDWIVPYAGPRNPTPGGVNFKSVATTIATFVQLTGCPSVPVSGDVPDHFRDGTSVRLTSYGPGSQGAEVILVDIKGGGHTWPGQQPAVPLIGKSTREISANAMMWEFFQKHPLPAAGPKR